MIHSSDVAFGKGPIRVAFSCDGAFVTFQFVRGEQALGHGHRLSREEAVNEGKKTMETGTSPYLPEEVGMMATEDVGIFGQCLLRYGEDGK